MFALGAVSSSDEKKCGGPVGAPPPRCALKSSLSEGAVGNKKNKEWTGRRVCEVLIDACSAADSRKAEDAEVVLARLEVQVRLQYNVRKDEAQYRLGSMYEDGADVLRDVQRAARLYEQAAMAGHAQAQCALGELFEMGDGVTMNLGKAAFWYAKAADAGDAHAQANLAALYAGGRGVARDPALAARYWALAAHQKHARAQYEYANALRYGDGLPADEAMARRFYRLAKDQGVQEADALLGSLLPTPSRNQSTRPETTFEEEDDDVYDDDDDGGIIIIGDDLSIPQGDDDPMKEEEDPRMAAIRAALDLEEKARATAHVWHVASAIAESLAKEARAKATALDKGRRSKRPPSRRNTV